MCASVYVLCVHVYSSVSWSCVLFFADVYRGTHAHTAVARSDVCNICVYICVFERVMVVCPLLGKRIRNSPSSSVHMSGLRASRVFAWRSVRAIKCVRVLQQQLPPSALCTVTHTHIRTHFLIIPSAPPRQMILFALQRTSYEHPIGDIRRLKAKVADNIVHHVPAGRALSVADLQQQCAVPGVSPPLRLFMGQRARTMGFELSDSIDRLKRFSDFEVLLQHNFLADRRYLSLGVLSVGIIIDLPLVFRPKLFTFPNNMSLESEQHLACGSTTEVFPPPRIRLYNTTTHDTQVYWQDTNLAKHRTPGTYCCSETVFQKYWNL